MVEDADAQTLRFALPPAYFDSLDVLIIITAIAPYDPQWAGKCTQTHSFLADLESFFFAQCFYLRLAFFTLGRLARYAYINKEKYLILELMHAEVLGPTEILNRPPIGQVSLSA